jgi:hypothetical protein
MSEVKEMEVTLRQLEGTVCLAALGRGRSQGITLRRTCLAGTKALACSYWRCPAERGRQSTDRLTDTELLAASASRAAYEQDTDFFHDSSRRRPWVPVSTRPAFVEPSSHCAIRLTKTGSTGHRHEGRVTLICMIKVTALHLWQCH